MSSAQPLKDSTTLSRVWKFGDLFGWLFFSIILYFASLVIIGEIEENDNYLFRRLKIIHKNDRAIIHLSSRYWHD